MNASGVQLFRLLDGQQHYMVPLFQRPYTWDKDQWSTLWNDLLETMDTDGDSRHFLGSVVTKSLPATAESVTPFLLIDGQQRLTTLTILLAALRDAVKESLPKLAKRIHEHYLTNEYASGLMQYKILPTQLDRPDYFAVIDGTPGNQAGKIPSAYSYFRGQLDKPGSDGEPLDINRLSTIVINGLEIVSITLSETDNEYSIFESLNAKGTPLTQADLLRNYFFMRIPNDRHGKLYPEVWVPMQDRINDGLADFFRYEYMSDGEFVRKWDVYQDWKKRLDKQNDEAVAENLRTLSHRSHFYNRIISPETEPDPGIAEGFQRLNRWGAQSTYPFLQYVYRQYDNGEISSKGFVEILRMLESFLVRRSLTRVSPNTLNRLFIRLSQQLPDGLDLVEGTRAALSEPSRRWPRDADFLESMLTYPLYTDTRPAQRRFILERLETSYSHKEHVALSTLTIEHVMPQKLSPEWLTALGDEAKEVHGRLLHVIGNLTLTGYNPELSNSPYERKRLLLQESNLEMNKEIAKEPQWTAREIEERSRRLAERALKIWPGPKS